MGMMRLGFGRQALGIGLAVALLAGCGGQTSSPGTMGLMPSGRAAHGGSWMKPGTSGSDLLYVSSRHGDVYVFTYPGGTPVGTLTGFENPLGVCSDKNGNVWITNTKPSGTSGYLLEYAHGSTSPIAMLSDPNEAPQDCSVDATTGNLAVANGCDGGSCNATIGIYVNAQGTPTLYSTNPPMGAPYTISYDGAGDVFVVGFEGVYKQGITWLPKGGSTVKVFPLRPHVFPRGVRWDGKYLVISYPANQIRQYKVQNGTGKATRRIIKLNGFCCGIYLIQGSTFIGGSASNTISFWHYPAGGNPVLTISGPANAVGVTVSVAPPASRIHE